MKFCHNFNLLIVDCDSLGMFSSEEDESVWNISCEEWLVVPVETHNLEDTDTTQNADKDASKDTSVPPQDSTEETSSYEVITIQGFQIMTYEDGDVYCGEMVNGQKHGQGVLKYGQSEFYYTGGWLNDMRHGMGVEKSSEGLYHGEWNENQMNGHGVFNFFTGDVYNGMFEQNCLCGEGSMAYIDGSKYTGMWYKNVRQGEGVFITAGKAVYDGTWGNDMKNGVFKVKLPHGLNVLREYKNDYQQGNAGARRCVL